MKKAWRRIWGISKRKMIGLEGINAKGLMQISRLNIKSLTLRVDWELLRSRLIREKWNMRDAYKKRMRPKRGSSTCNRSWTNRQTDNLSCWSQQMRKDLVCSRPFWKDRDTRARVSKKREIETRWLTQWQSSIQVQTTISAPSRKQVGLNSWTTSVHHLRVFIRPKKNRAATTWWMTATTHHMTENQEVQTTKPKTRASLSKNQNGMSSITKSTRTSNTASWRARSEQMTRVSITRAQLINRPHTRSSSSQADSAMALFQVQKTSMMSGKEVEVVTAAQTWSELRQIHMEPQSSMLATWTSNCLQYMHKTLNRLLSDKESKVFSQTASRLSTNYKNNWTSLMLDHLKKFTRRATVNPSPKDIKQTITITRTTTQRIWIITCIGNTENQSTITSC